MAKKKKQSDEDRVAGLGTPEEVSRFEEEMKRKQKKNKKS